MHVQAINKDKLYSTEDGEPKQVDDPEEAIGESQLRHALMFDEYAIAKVLSLCEFTPQVVPPTPCPTNLDSVSSTCCAVLLAAQVLVVLR
jgi:hypothetical protein